MRERKLNGQTEIVFEIEKKNTAEVTLHEMENPK